jgi:hypothetical protein
VRLAEPRLELQQRVDVEVADVERAGAVVHEAEPTREVRRPRRGRLAR